VCAVARQKIGARHPGHGMMPEGFAALELGINVEGEALGYFKTRSEKVGFLRIPYFVYRDSE